MRGRQQTARDAARERDERDADVVDEDLGREARLLGRAEDRALGARLGNAPVLARHEAARRTGILERPGAGQERRPEEQDAETRERSGRSATSRQ